MLLGAGSGLGRRGFRQSISLLLLESLKILFSLFELDGLLLD